MAKQLSPKSVTVLGLIADGHSYSQIVDGYPDISYLDIFAAAEEALRLNEKETNYHDRIAGIKTRHPRAYEKWTEGEDAELLAMCEDGSSIETISKRFQRQPSAIRSRLAKLDRGNYPEKPSEA